MMSEGISSAKVLCEGCQENVATHRCVDCPQFSCDNCVKVHRSIPAIRSHHILSIDAHQDAEDFVQPVVYCSIHNNNPIILYCDICQMSVCETCTFECCIPEHAKRDIQIAANDFQKQIREMIDELKVKGRGLDENKTLAEQICCQIKDKQSQEEQKVRRRTEEIIEKLRKEEEQLLEELNQDYGKELKRVEVEIEEIDLQIRSIKSTQIYLQILIHHGNAMEILPTLKDAASRTKEAVTMETKPTQSVRMIEFQASTNNSVILGTLKTSEEVCLSNCTVENVPKRLWKGDSANLLVTTRDSSGKHVIPREKVKVKVKKPDGSWEDIWAKDNRDGTQTVTLRGDTVGKYQVAVMMGDESFPGHPVTITVTKQSVKTLGSHGNKQGQYNHPYSVALNRKGNVVTAETGNNRLQTTTIHGRFLKSVKFTNFVTPYTPCDIAISKDNLYYSVDDSSKQVIVTDENGQFIKSFGQNELKDPYGVAVSPVDNKVYVTDPGEDCVRTYTRYGNHLRSFGSKGKGEGEFACPCFLAVDSVGRVFIADSDNHRIQVFSTDDKFLYAFGRYGDKDGMLNCPRGVAIEKDRYVYISDNNRVQKFDINGQFICRIDHKRDGLDYPIGIAVTNDVPCKVVVVDHGNHSLKVFAQ